MPNEASDGGFDVQKAIKSIDAYSNSTGIGSLIIDTKGCKLYESCKNSSLCQLCAQIHSAQSSRSSCETVHLYGSYQAERFGGMYIYFCPAGLTYWASPISTREGKQGAFIGGPVLMMDPEEFLIEDFMSKSGMFNTEVAKIRNYINQVPVTQPGKVNDLAQLLFIVASSISSDSASKHDDNRKYHEIQSHISEWVHHIKNTDSREIRAVNYPFDKEKELLSKIALGDKPGSQRVLNEILGYVFFSSGQNFEIIKARILELTVLLSRAAVEGGADTLEIFGLNYKYLTDIHQLKTIEDLTFWLSKIMARFTDCVFNLADIRHKDIIYKAVDYIKRNYQVRVTLEDVANHVYLNPSYFSKIFKSEMKCNFVSYVNKIRINVSKNLLLDISIPLADVSGLVGFEDQSYFTKVFKKSTGITPGKFREFGGHHI